jgi:hypothetical protein
MSKMSVYTIRSVSRDGVSIQLTGDVHATSVAWGDLDTAATQADASLAALYSHMRTTARNLLAAQERKAVAKCSGHAAVRSFERAFRHTVSVDDEDPRAHGNVTKVEVCRCGANRLTNMNQGYVESGDWHYVEEVQ